MEALSEALIYGGRIDEGLDYVQKAIQQNPVAIARALYLKGLSEYIRGNLPQAVAFLQDAVEFAPRYTGVSAILAAAYAEQGDIDRAWASYLVFGRGALRELIPTVAFTNSWFPFSTGDVLERFARNLAAAGAVDTGHFPIYEKNRLDDTDIRALLFDTRVDGTGFWNYEKWTQRRSADGKVEHSGAPIVTGGYSSGEELGFGRIVDNVLCERWPEFSDVGDICVTLFKMPESDSITTRRGDYVMVTDLGPMPFRLVE